MNKDKTKDEKIAELLISRLPYSQIIDQLHTGNSRISRVAAQLKKNNFDTLDNLPFTNFKNTF